MGRERERRNNTAQKHAVTRESAERRGSNGSTHGSCGDHALEGGVAREEEGRERVHGATRRARGSATRELADGRRQAEGTRKARGKSGNAPERQRARGGDVCNVRVADSADLVFRRQRRSSTSST